jgi:hypothetical protein
MALFSPWSVGEGVGRPQSLVQFLPRHHLAGAFQQHHQNLKWLILKLAPRD